MCCAQSAGSDDSASCRKKRAWGVSERQPILRRQLLPRELPNRLQHPVALLGKADEALLDERLQGVELGVADHFGCLERAAPGEDREAGEELLLCGGEQVVAPLDGCAQGLLAGIGVAAALEQVEAGGEALQDLGRGERLRAGGGELDGEREVVQARAELGDLVGGLELGARAEEGDGLGGGERGDRVLDLAGDAQELAARDEQGEVGAGLQELGELGGGLHHLLQVVEQEQHLSLADVLGEAVLGSEGLGDRLADEGGVSERGEPDPEDARLVGGDEGGGGLERQPGLAGAAGPGEGDRRAPASILASTSASSRSRPRKELAGRGRFVFEIVLSGGKLPSPSW